MTDLGESGASPPDEVSMPELDVTLHGCKGGPVMGVPRDSLVHLPRVSSLGTSGDSPEVTSLRSVAEGKRSGEKKSGNIGHPADHGEHRPPPTAQQSRVAKDAHSGDKEGSDAPSETGAVNEISSEDEGKGWATPRNLAEDAPAFPLTIAEDQHRTDLPLNAISWREDSHPQWVRVRSVMDSGAAQSVAPPSMAPGVVIEASPGSQRGQHYVSASGGRLPNMGQQKMKVQTNEGRDAMVLYQVAELSRPLTAVSETCDNGNWVVFTPEGGFIWNLKTGGRTNFERRGGIYELDLWVKEEDLQPAGFPRPGH